MAKFEGEELVKFSEYNETRKNLKQTLRTMEIDKIHLQAELKQLQRATKPEITEIDEIKSKIETIENQEPILDKQLTEINLKMHSMIKELTKE